jgi:hypothetical protein
MKSIVLLILLIIFMYLYFNNCKENYAPRVETPLNKKSLSELNTYLSFYLMLDKQEVIIFNTINYNKPRLVLNSKNFYKINKYLGEGGRKRFKQETSEIINAIDLRLNEKTPLPSTRDIEKANLLKSLVKGFLEALEALNK